MPTMVSKRISPSMFPNSMEEPFAVSNPSVRLLKRMALRLGERVGYLIGESEESDPIWIDSHASWRSWIDKTTGVDAATALKVARRVAARVRERTADNS